MKHAQGVLAVLSLALVSTCVLAAEDFDIADSGEYPFEAGSEYARLRMTATGKTVTLTQDELTSPVLFSGFSALTDDKATFSGVWFDFGQSGAPGPFLDHEDKAHRREFVVDGGSVLTNISSFVLTGWDTGLQNRFRIDGASRLYAQKISVSDAPWNIRQARFSVLGGSKVETTGSVYLNDGQLNSSGCFYSGNRLEVSGLGSLLNVGANLGVGGVLNDGWAWKGSAEGGSTTGGNTLAVTNGGAVTVAGTLIVGGGSSTFSNALVVADGGTVTVRNVLMDISSSGKYNAGFSGDRIEVLDGGMLRVTEDFQLGYSSTSGVNGFGGGELVISNGTVAIGGAFKFAGGSRCTNYIVRVSGPRASFTVGTTAGKGFFVGGTAGPHNAYVFENGADFTSPYPYYSYNSAPKFCTIAVRTGAKFRTAVDHFHVGGSNTPNGNMTNLFSVASGASLLATSFHVVGYGCELAVSNATVDVSGTVTSASDYGALYGTLSIGTSDRYSDNYYGKSTNCVLCLAGEAPRVIATNGAVTVRSASTVRYELPAGGYAGVSPVVDTFRFHLDEGSALEFVGAEEMLARHTTEGKNGKYILARAKNLEIPEDVFEKAREKLPGHVTLKVRDVAEGKQALVLGVHATGLMILFR